MDGPRRRHIELETPLVQHGPDHRHLYLLILGIALGVVLGPAVLGRLSPAWYDTLFIGAAEITQELTNQQQRQDQLIEQMQATGDEAALATLTAELSGRASQRRAELQQQLRDRADRPLRWLLGLALAIAVVMVVEALLEPGHVLGRVLMTARYLLLSAMLALLLARSSLVQQISLPAAGIALGVVLLLAWGFCAVLTTQDAKSSAPSASDSSSAPTMDRRSS